MRIATKGVRDEGRCNKLSRTQALWRKVVATNYEDLITSNSGRIKWITLSESLILLLLKTKVEAAAVLNLFNPTPAAVSCILLTQPPAFMDKVKTC